MEAWYTIILGLSEHPNFVDRFMFVHGNNRMFFKETSRQFSENSVNERKLFSEVLEYRFQSRGTTGCLKKQVANFSEIKDSGQAL